MSDEDAERYIKIFTLLDKETVEALIAEHREAPHLRKLQKRLAEELTVMIHSREEYERAVAASSILFGGGAGALKAADERTILEVFEGVPQFEISASDLAVAGGVPFATLCTEKASVFASKGELRRLVQGGGISFNGTKVADAEQPVTTEDLISGKFLLVQKGKKNYFLLIAK